ncbi:hypothetical protein ACHAXR_007559 [Thalassiosira sp. AJA248-18]
MENNSELNTMNRDLGCASDAAACTANSLTGQWMLMAGTPLLVNPEASSRTAIMDLMPQSPPLQQSTTITVTNALLWTATSLAIIILYYLRRLRCQSKEPYSYYLFPPSTRLPPCVVPPHPIFGHMPNVFSPPDSANYTSIFLDHADSSGISTFRFLNIPSVSVLKAEHARAVFRNSIERGGSKIIARHFKRCLGEDSLVMMEGGEGDREKWRQHRSLVKVAFTTHAVENMANKVWEVANGFTSSILRECAKNKNQDTPSQGSYCAEAADLFKWVTLDIFGKVAFNYRFGCTETLTTTPLATSLNYTVEDSNARCQAWNLLKPAYQFYCIPTQRNKDYQMHSDNVHGLLRDICRKRMEKITNEKKNGPSVHCKDDDLLSSLLKSKSKSMEIKPDDSHEDSVKMLLTLFFAGYDTSSVLLSMVMWSIAKNPKIQQECAKEAHAASNSSKSCTENNEPSLHEDASQWESRLAYCRAVIFEALRMHPPVYTNSRTLSKAVELDGYIIPAKTRVYLPLMQIQTDERNFTRAAEFLPERWVRKEASTGRWVARDHKTEPRSVENDSTYIPPANPHNIFTFSGGARNCVGHRLAVQESTIVLACLVDKLTVDVPEGLVVQKRKKFALAPPVEMPLIFRRRDWQR